jgi:hypothetical protein
MKHRGYLLTESERLVIRGMTLGRRQRRHRRRLLIAATVVVGVALGLLAWVAA